MTWLLTPDLGHMNCSNSTQTNTVNSVYFDVVRYDSKETQSWAEPYSVNQIIGFQFSVHEAGNMK